MNLYGIWIDHAHAFIVKAQPSGEMTIQQIESGISPHFHHHSGGTQEGEHVTITNQHHGDQTRINQIHAYAERIIGMLQDAHEIAIFGPSNAKYDLRHILQEKHKDLAGKLGTFETTDKMTENQLTAFVKKIFRLPRI